MNYKLGSNVKIGNKILLKTGWKKVIDVQERGVDVKDCGFIKFGETIYGWKAS